MVSAGVAILPDGSSGAILSSPDEVRRIQAPSAAIMLIDMTKCGRIRVDETCPADAQTLDFGLRVWEAGFEVVCTPRAEVIRQIHGQAKEHAERGSVGQGLAAPGRLTTLREGIWKQFPDISWIESKVEEIDRFFEQTDAVAIADGAPALVRSVQFYAALKNYIAALALKRAGDRPLRVDDPESSHWALLGGLSGRAVLYEAGFHGCNIILQNFTYYALPEHEGARYLRRLEADSIDELKAKIVRSARAPHSGHTPRGAVVTSPSLRDLIPQVTAPSPAPPGGQSDDTVAEAVHTAAPSGNLLLHFCSEGIRQGLKPNPLFDPAYYLATNPDVTASGVNPLAHFLDSGASAGRRPNPLFDPAYYLRQYPDAAASGLNPLEHFLESGAAKGYKPCPLFDTAYYIERHPELSADGINALAHFLDSGARAGYNPHPLFDTVYYAAHTANVGAMNPLAHFMEVGAGQGCNPCALFDTAYYVAQNPEAAASPVNPLQHFLENGAAEGRRPNPFFDPAYYFEQNPEVRKSGQNPLVHFMETGAKAGRRPNPLFDCDYYRLQNPEVAQSGMNPLSDFLEQGSSPRTVAPGFMGSAFYGSSNGHQPRAAAKLSVVIATRDRRESVSRTIEACWSNRGQAEIELVVVDAGSKDDTLARLKKMAAAIPGLRHYSLKDSNLFQARNIGADLASNEVILFLDEQACPQNDDFFQVHAALHGRYADRNLAVLGPARGASHEPVVSALQKVLGRGAAQFGNGNLTPFAFVAWPFFDATNVSVKKTLVADWILDGFERDAANRRAAELDLACRAARSTEGIRLFYNPAARVTFGQQNSSAEELDDQYAVGMAISQLVRRNPELACDCTPDTFLHDLRCGAREPDEAIVADYRRLIDGFKAWARMQDWTELTPAAFEVFLLDGFASGWVESGGDAAVALPLLAHRFQLAAGWFFSFVAAG
jgi:hypothetical protein